MKSLMVALTLLVSLDTFAITRRRICNMDRPKAPCLMKESDATMWLFGMMMLNAEGTQMVDQISEEIESEGLPKAVVTLLQTNKDQTKQWINFKVTWPCKAELRACKEYLWKVDVKSDENAEEGPTETYTNKLIKVPLKR